MLIVNKKVFKTKRESEIARKRSKINNLKSRPSHFFKTETR